MVWTAFNNQVEVTAQVKIIATKSEKPLTRCENFSFRSMLKEGVKPEEQKAYMETLTKSRFGEEFLKRIREDVAVKRLVGSTSWHVDVLNVDYE